MLIRQHIPTHKHKIDDFIKKTENIKYYLKHVIGIRINFPLQHIRRCTSVIIIKINKTRKITYHVGDTYKNFIFIAPKLSEIQYLSFICNVYFNIIYVDNKLYLIFKSGIFLNNNNFIFIS